MCFSEYEETVMKGVSLALLLCGLFNCFLTDASYAGKGISNLTIFIKEENISKDTPDLDFSDNSIEQIEPLIFVNFSHLIVVTLDRNVDLQLISDDSPILESSSIEEFSCNECKIRKISPETFSKMPRLKYLRLKMNGLREIEARAFDNNPDLQELSLQGNELRELPGNLVESVALKSLHLDNNSLYNFPKAEPCLISRSLKNFTCGVCGITEIYEETFSQLPNLLELHLQKNPIQHVDEKSFSSTELLCILSVNTSVVNKLPLQITTNFCLGREKDKTFIMFKQGFDGKTCKLTADQIIKMKRKLVTTTTTTTTTEGATTTTETEEEVDVTTASVNPTLLDALIATYLLIFVILEGLFFAAITLYLTKIVRSKPKEFDYSTSVVNPSDIYKIN